MLSLLSGTVTFSRINGRYNDTHCVSGERKETRAKCDYRDTKSFKDNARKSWNMHCHTKKTESHQYCMTNFSVSWAGDWQVKQDQNFRVVGTKKDGGCRGAEYSNEKNPVWPARGFTQFQPCCEDRKGKGRATDDSHFTEEIFQPDWPSQELSQRKKHGKRRQNIWTVFNFPGYNWYNYTGTKHKGLDIFSWISQHQIYVCNSQDHGNHCCYHLQ